MTAQKKVDLRSLDIADDRRQHLKALFPEVFNEGRIDFDQLKRVLGEWVEPGKERFGLNWPGKAECMKVIQAPSVATLKPCREESVNFDDTENLFIEGDNLEVLKLLQKSYFGQVKMIYIDPPYNTGNEFIYPDKFSETLDTYLEYTGQKDSEGRKFSTNTDTQGRYHSSWLSMMYPRLYLARNLLREDGVIFISIDDTEVGNLRNLTDEVFGEDNFIANLIWQKKYTRSNDAKWFSDNHDHILCYAKQKDIFGINQLPRNDEQLAAYKNPDRHPKGPWKATPLHAKSGSNTSPYIFINGTVWSPPPGTYRRFNDTSMKLMEDNNEIWFGDDGKQTPQRKSFLCDVKDGVTPTTLWLYQEVGHNHEASNELKELGMGGAFDNPKPTRLIQRMMQLSQSASKDDIILDFFAGSGTTAHAVIKANKEDNGKRKFITIQLPEKIDEKNEAYKAGFKSISHLSVERIRRAAMKIESAECNQLDLSGASNLDLGFKIFKLARSNFKVWEGDVERIQNLEKQLSLHVDHISASSTPEDILYELLLKSGFSLTTKVEKLTLASKEVFSIEEGALLICLDKNLTQAVIDAIADAGPVQVICLDEGFKGNDQLKTNAVQTFKSRAQAEESEIVFRTV
ncbi:site-specific DNA-methyltransferase [Pseudochelatococcus sp. G4_1912]|uniref:site-specific DNA-methyltransferase n=1 Tax=Pseudochelatococcus sp. G4_1912 TaxID=3114288 RepID=UPI0039C6D1FF